MRSDDFIAGYEKALSDFSHLMHADGYFEGPWVSRLEELWRSFQETSQRIKERAKKREDQ